MEKHVYFVRHGESTSNKDGIRYGADAVLTDKGKQEAQIIAGRLKKIGVDAIISSSYVRARETARPAAELLHLPLEENDLFIEYRGPSILLGKSWRKPEPEYRALEAKRADEFGVTDYRHSDEETFEDYRARAVAALRYLEQHPAERIAVFSHGLFLRAVFCAVFFDKDFTGHDLKRSFKLLTANTGINYLRQMPGKNGELDWYIDAWNDSAHLG